MSTKAASVKILGRNWYLGSDSAGIGVMVVHDLKFYVDANAELNIVYFQWFSSHDNAMKLSKW